jgi:hypothetical protein
MSNVVANVASGPKVGDYALPIALFVLGGLFAGMAWSAKGGGGKGKKGGGSNVKMYMYALLTIVALGGGVYTFNSGKSFANVRAAGQAGFNAAKAKYTNFQASRAAAAGPTSPAIAAGGAAPGPIPV